MSTPAAAAVSSADGVALGPHRPLRGPADPQLNADFARARLGEIHAHPSYFES